MRKKPGQKAIAFRLNIVAAQRDETITGLPPLELNELWIITKFYCQGSIHLIPPTRESIPLDMLLSGYKRI